MPNVLQVYSAIWDQVIRVKFRTGSPMFGPGRVSTLMCTEMKNRDQWLRAVVDQQLERSSLALGVVGSNSAHACGLRGGQAACTWIILWFSRFLLPSSFHQSSHHYPSGLSQSYLETLKLNLNSESSDPTSLVSRSVRG